MKEFNENNDQKIVNFMEVSKINDIELAKKYLISSNWNESQALNNYFIGNNKNNIEKEKKINLNKIPNKNNANKNQNDNDDEGFLSKYIFSPIMSLFSSCYSNADSELEEDSKIFQYLPNKIKDFHKFNQFIKKYLGIIIFYNKNNIEFLRELINKICRNSTLMNILKQKCVIFPIYSLSSNGYKIIDILSDSNLICPSIIFCYDKHKENIFGKNNIIEKLEGESVNIDEFYKNLMNSINKIEQINNINDNINNDNIENNNFNTLTDAEILQKQKYDMEQLEQNIEKINLENNSKKKKFEEIEKISEKLKTKFEKEPDENNQDCCTICFRYPDGDKNINRRFLKTDKIKTLYEYIKSLGTEIYTEDGNGTFSLYQPFPPKKYENMENTLEKEGLFPNGVIQIKEE